MNVDFDLSKFQLPPGFRGRSAAVCQVWWIVQSTLFALSPQFMYSWRNWLLRMFGAKLGKNVLVRPTARITFPWKLQVGDNSWIGDNVAIYNLAQISIGSNSVISQRSYLCTGSHDYQAEDFKIAALPINIGSSSWIATDVFVAPGVCIGNNVVVGARSTVFSDLPSGKIYTGSPAKLHQKKINAKES